FGMNDLVATDRLALYDTGLTGTSPHGFTAGETITFRFNSAGGARLRDIQVAVPAGGTVNDLITALNAQAGGVGRYGAFSLDAGGALKFTPSGQPPATLSVFEDTTTQTASGVSMTELFGLGAGVRGSRADGFSVRADIAQNPARLALAKLELGVAPGVSSLSNGDGRGALALADAGQQAATFQS